MIFPKGNKHNSIIPIRCPLCHKEKFLKSLFMIYLGSLQLEINVTVVV